MLSKRKVAKICVISELKKIVMSSENEVKKRKTSINRRYWVKPFLIKRCEFDIGAHLLRDLLWEDDDKDFNNFCRLNIHQFENMLALIQDKLQKQKTHMRDPISPRTKLAITLRYLATGDSFSSMEFLARVSRSTISVFIPTILRCIYDALKCEYMKVPDTAEKWKNIADDFNGVWQFPHVLGALDEKHIRIKAPENSGSQFYNFKGFFSVVLFAAVDAHCRFIFVDVGSNGKASDSTIYQDSYLYSSLQNGQLNIPKSSELITGRGSNIPYYFIADDAFMIDKNLLKPYSRSLKLNYKKEIFNYRLCRARMVVECAFGRLARRFGIFNRPIEVQTSTVDLIVLTTCALHNLLTKKTAKPTASEVTENLPATFSSISHQQHKSYKYSCRIRDEVAEYLVADGNVDFQWKKISLRNF